MIRICQHVEGIPLAIEMAAALVRATPIATIERNIRANLDVLATTLRDIPARHRSLRAVFDQSWSLLTEAEQALLRRIAVFRGCDMVAAEQVAGATPQLLEALVDKSLVRPEHEPIAGSAGDTPRFTMLETLRAYALEQLEASGELDALQQKHAVYYLALAEEAAPQLNGPAQQQWLRRLDREHENLRATLGRALQEEPRAAHRELHTQPCTPSELGLRLAAALWQFWRLRGYAAEGVVWMERALARRGEVAPALRVAALNRAGYLFLRQGHYDQATAVADESLDLARACADATGCAFALGVLGHVALVRGERERGVAQFDESLRLCGSGAGWLRSWLLNGRAELALMLGETARAMALCHESLALFEAIEDWEGRARALDHLGQAYWWQGELAQATAHWEASLAVFRALGDRQGGGWILNHLGDLARQQADYALARARYDEALRTFAEIADRLGHAAVLHNLGDVDQMQGDYATATRVFTESLTIFYRLKHLDSVADCLVGLAGAQAPLGQGERAVRMLGAVAAWRGVIDPGAAFANPANRAAWERSLAAARTTLDEPTFAAAWAAGAALTLDQAVDEMLAG
ncbi:MAG: ATP-binding protein [Roseiflexaceae bacterium]